MDFRDKTIYATVALDSEYRVATVTTPSAKLLPHYLEDFCNLLPILERIDSKEHIWFLKSTTLEILLFRHQITFIWKDNRFECKEFPGYYLSEIQELPTLKFLKSYLSLEANFASSGKKLLVIPNGKIEANFQITNPNTQIPYFGYEINTHQKCLVATSIESRLYLALLYTKTSSLVPDALTGMTGYQTALALLRRCWQNKPYQDFEWEMLKEIEETQTPSQPSGAIWLLVYLLKKASLSMKFLYSVKNTQQTEEDELQLKRTQYIKVKRLQPVASLLTHEEEVGLIDAGGASITNVIIRASSNLFQRCTKIFLLGSANISTNLSLFFRGQVSLLTVGS
jgi:hypothetical protein